MSRESLSPSSYEHRLLVALRDQLTDTPGGRAEWVATSEESPRATLLSPYAADDPGPRRLSRRRLVTAGAAAALVVVVVGVLFATSDDDDPGFAVSSSGSAVALLPDETLLEQADVLDVADTDASRYLLDDDMLVVVPTIEAEAPERVAYVQAASGAGSTTPEQGGMEIAVGDRTGTGWKYDSGQARVEVRSNDSDLNVWSEGGFTVEELADLAAQFEPGRPIVDQDPGSGWDVLATNNLALSDARIREVTLERANGDRIGLQTITGVSEEALWILEYRGSPASVRGGIGRVSQADATSLSVSWIEQPDTIVRLGYSAQEPSPIDDVIELANRLVPADEDGWRSFVSDAGLSLQTGPSTREVVGDAATTTLPLDEGQTGRVAPAWYAERPPLESCGTDAESTPAYPNVAAGDCFRLAYETGTPAELTWVTYGDEGESRRAHFRVLGPGSYEVLTESVPSNASTSSPGMHVAGADSGWTRFRCDRFVFRDEPGYEIDGAPILNAEGECEQVDRVDG